MSTNEIARPSAQVAAGVEGFNDLRPDILTDYGACLKHSERAPHRRWDALRALADEWPLVTAVLPTVAILAGAGWGWWPADGVEDPAFTLNIGLLFGLGLATARWSGRSWAVALRTGLVDALLGVVVVVANAVIK